MSFIVCCTRNFTSLQFHQFGCLLGIIDKCETVSVYISGLSELAKLRSVQFLMLSCQLFFQLSFYTCIFNCALKYCLCHIRGTWDVTITCGYYILKIFPWLTHEDTYTVKPQWLENLWTITFFRNMGSSSYWGLIMAQVQEAKVIL